MNKYGRRPIFNRIPVIRGISTEDLGVYALVAAVAVTAAPVAYQLNFGPSPTSTEITVECSEGLSHASPNGEPFGGVTYISCIDGNETNYDPRKVSIPLRFIFGDLVDKSENAKTYVATCDNNSPTSDDIKFPAPILDNSSLAPNPYDTMKLSYKLVCEQGSTPRLSPLDLAKS